MSQTLPFGSGTRGRESSGSGGTSWSSSSRVDSQPDLDDFIDRGDLGTRDREAILDRPDSCADLSDDDVLLLCETAVDVVDGAVLRVDSFVSVDLRGNHECESVRASSLTGGLLQRLISHGGETVPIAAARREWIRLPIDRLTLASPCPALYACGDAVGVQIAAEDRRRGRGVLWARVARYDDPGGVMIMRRTGARIVGSRGLAFVLVATCSRTVSKHARLLPCVGWFVPSVACRARSKCVPSAERLSHRATGRHSPWLPSYEPRAHKVPLD